MESDLTTKAWLVTNGIATKTVTKRDAVSATTTAVDSHTTYVVSGNEYADEMQLRAIALQKRYKGRIQSDRVARSLTTPPARLVARQVSPAAALITPPARLAARQGGAAAPSCTWGYEISGAEDIEVGDLGFDPPLDADLSTPQCSPAGVPLSDLQAVIDTLDGQGDDGYMFDNCCGGGSVSCLQQGTSGLATVDLCGGTELECIGCAQLANYLQGMASSCNSNGQVGGSQEINEANSLTVSINLNSSG